MGFYWLKFANFAELIGVIVTLVLLPVNRLPYIHYTPFGIGFISLILLLVAVLRRSIDLVKARDVKKN